MGERGFEAPNIGNDLWSMGFDVDLALESPLQRKNILSSSMNLTGPTSSLNNNSYGYMNQMLLFNNEDISQITDLTNSLPSDSSQKGIEESLFGQVAAAHQENSLLSNKRPLEPTDVYGRVTCYEGKLVIQLRLSNLNASYPMNVRECWLCRERINPGSSLHAHKHVLHGVFHANDEFVQMDIDHFIIPDQALDPPDSKDITDIMNNSSLINGPGTETFDTSQPINFDELNSSVPHEGSQPMSEGGWHPQSIGVEPSVSNSSLLQHSKPENEMKYPTAPIKQNANTTQNSFTSLPVPPNNCLNSFSSFSPGNGLLSNDHSLLGHSSTGHFSSVLPSNRLGFQPSLSSSPLSNNLTRTLLNSTSKNSLMGVNSTLSKPNPTNAVQCSVTGNSATNSLLTSNSLVNHNILSTSCSTTTIPGPPATGGEVPMNRLNDVDSLGGNALSNNLKLHSTNLSLPNNILNSNSIPASCFSPSMRSNSIDVLQTSSNIGIPNANLLNKDTNPSLDSTIKHDKNNCQNILNFSPTCNETQSLNSSAASHSQSLSYPSNDLKRNNLDATRKVEIGAKKRKSKAQKKMSVIKMKEESTHLESIISSKKMDGASSSKYALDSWLDSNLSSPNPNDCSLIGQKSNSTATSHTTGIKKTKLNSTTTKIHSAEYKLLKEKVLNEQISCKVCKQEFVKEWRAYKEHMGEHGVPDSEMYACALCSRKSSSSKHYLQHIKTHASPRYTCQVCNTSFSRPDKLQRHINSVHHKICQYKCNICNKSFLRMEYLKKHSFTHNGTKFKCDNCNMSFSNKYNLEVHKRTHAKERPFKCELCDSEFVRRDFLDNHMEKDHKKKKIKCNICGKLFCRTDSLTRHKRIHTNRSFPCSMCSNKYARKDLLKAHEDSHRDPGRHKCTQCPAAFNRREILLKHLVIHQTKSQCNICLKFLPSTLKLQNHLLWHEKRGNEKSKSSIFKCEQCTKEFSTEEQKQKHVDKFHNKSSSSDKVTKDPVERGEKKFFCSTCSKGFTRSCNLRAHLKTHNKSTDDETILSELPSVLIASKSLPKQKKKIATPSLTQIGDSPIVPLEPLEGHHNPSFISKEILCANAPFLRPLEESFSNVPHSSHSSYTTNFNPTTSPTDLPTPGLAASTCPSSPITLSTEVLTAAAYLLAYPTYAGPYQ